jgi:xylulokinase
MTRAVLEGVAFGLRDSLELIRQAGLGSIDQLRIAGGGARSPLWRQIIADIMNVPLATVNTTEGGAFGAALLAGVGAGWWPTVDAACQATIRVTMGETPNPQNAARYDALYQQYQQLYPALKSIFHNL